MENQETKDEQKFCPSCKGSGICLTCNGTDRWYAGSFNEEKCGESKQPEIIIGFSEGVRNFV